MIYQAFQIEFLSNLFDVHCSRKVLFIRKYQQICVFKRHLLHLLMYFLSAFVHSFTIICVNNPYKRVKVLIIVAPEEPDFVATADIPHIELNIFHGHRLYVETDSGNGIHNLSQLEFVKNRCFASCV